MNSDLLSLRDVFQLTVFDDRLLQEHQHVGSTDRAVRVDAMASSCFGTRKTSRVRT